MLILHGRKDVHLTGTSDRYIWVTPDPGETTNKKLRSRVSCARSTSLASVVTAAVQAAEEKIDLRPKFSMYTEKKKLQQYHLITPII